MPGGYLRILGSPSVQSCCTLSIYVSYHVVVYPDIANPDLFVCSCRTCFCLDITSFYEEYRQPSWGSTWPACEKMVIVPPLLGTGGFDTICNHHDSSTLVDLSFGACRNHSTVLYGRKGTTLTSYLHSQIFQICVSVRSLFSIQSHTQNIAQSVSV